MIFIDGSGATCIIFPLLEDQSSCNLDEDGYWM